MDVISNFKAFINRRVIFLSENRVREIIQFRKAQPWFLYIFRMRYERPELYETCFFLARKLPKNAKILETGCGCGTNLIWFGQSGMSNLYGTDIDSKAINAAIDLAKLANLKIKFYKDNSTNPKRLPNFKFDAILALNWIHYDPSFDLEKFINKYHDFLSGNGYLAIEVIDKSYNLIPKNKYLTADWNKPKSNRRPSEYLHRYSFKQVTAAASKSGLKIIKMFNFKNIIPRRVYILTNKT